MAREVVLVGACRTPVGTFGGTIKDVGAADLGALVMGEAITRAADAVLPVSWSHVV